jgi:hypothetical protein
MTLTQAVTVPVAAVRLGRSERTIWRQIRAGELRTRREGRRVLVLVDAEQAWPGTPAHAIREAAAPYGAGHDWQVGQWPYTREIVERHRQAKLARRRAAIETINELSKRTRPDPDGLTGLDYIHAERDHPRALEGGDAADRALEGLARGRRRHR